MKRSNLYNRSHSKLRRQVAELDKERNRQGIRFLLVDNYLEQYKLCNQAEVYGQNLEQTKCLALKNDITRYKLQQK